VQYLADFPSKRTPSTRSPFTEPAYCTARPAAFRQASLWHIGCISSRTGTLLPMPPFSLHASQLLKVSPDRGMNMCWCFRTCPLRSGSTLSRRRITKASLAVPAAVALATGLVEIYNFYQFRYRSSVGRFLPGNSDI
jgi:hypothetical protein